jgi:hypothetical protein
MTAYESAGKVVVYIAIGEVLVCFAAVSLFRTPYNSFLCGVCVCAFLMRTVQQGGESE